MSEDVYIPTFIINLPQRKDRLAHIRSQFAGREEFDVTVIPACEHRIGAIGLWQSITGIVREAQQREHDVILICEDDHVFTEHYSADYLFDNIIEAHEQDADVLLGGIAGFGETRRAAAHRFLIDVFYGTQFMLVYNKFFSAILEADFGMGDAADEKISTMTLHKSTLYPFVSVQHDFGYSDVTLSNQYDKGRVDRLFRDADARLKAQCLSAR